MQHHMSERRDDRGSAAGAGRRVGLKCAPPGHDKSVHTVLRLQKVGHRVRGFLEFACDPLLEPDSDLLGVRERLEPHRAPSARYGVFVVRAVI